MKRVMLSTIETSISRPLPVRWRRSSAATHRHGASWPASRSAAGVPTFCGGPFRLAGQVHDARIAFGDQVVAGQLGALARQPEAGQRDVDQIRGLRPRSVG